MSPALVSLVLMALVLISLIRVTVLVSGGRAVAARGRPRTQAPGHG